MPLSKTSTLRAAIGSTADTLRGHRRRARSSAARFARNERGVVAIVFGIALLPAMILAGGATDYVRGTSLKAKAQGAADAAALAGARYLSKSDAELDAIVRGVLDANLPAAYRGRDFTLSRVDDGSALRVDFTASMDNYFLGLTSLISGTDMSTTTIGVTSVAKAGERAEIALVVDVTGSMKPHIDALREGAGDFVDILFQGAETSENVRVSLVPYVTTVNVSDDPSHKSWMDWDGKSKFHGNWFERINAGWGQRKLFVSRDEECRVKPAPPKPTTPKPTTPKPTTPTPSEPPSQPQPPAPPKPTPPSIPGDLGLAPGLPNGDAIWDRFATVTGDALYSGLDALAGVLVTPASAADDDEDEKSKKPKKPKKVKTAKDASNEIQHGNWENGDAAAWIDMDMTSEEYFDCDVEIENVNHFDLYKVMGLDWAGCVEMRPEPYDVTDTPPSKSRPDTLFVPYLWPDEMDVKGSSDAAVGKTTSRNSYIDDDRETPEWVLNDKPKTAKSKWRDNVGSNGASVQGFLWKYKSVNGAELRNTFGFTGAKGFDEQSPNAACPDPIVPLTDTRAPLDERIGALRAYKGSGTNVALGMAWGWRTLSPGAPFTQGLPYGEERNRKIIVLMTDGVNMMEKQDAWWTKSDYTGIGYAKEARLGTEDRDQIRAKLDAKLLEICETVKKDHEIEVYTVMFNPDKGWWMDTVRKNLQACATDASHAYEATSADDLVEVFGQIGNAISKLRLTR